MTTGGQSHSQAATTQARRRLRLGVLPLALAAVVLGVSIYRSTQSQAALPELSASVCRWAGQDLVVSGTVVNTTGSRYDVAVKPDVRFATSREHGVYFSWVDTIPAHASRTWSVRWTPRYTTPGAPITRCDAVARHDAGAGEND